MSKRYEQWGYESFKDNKTGEIYDNYIDLLNQQDQQIAELKAENTKLQQQLKDNTKQVCEKIKEFIFNESEENYGLNGSMFFVVQTQKLNKFLDQIGETK